MIDEQVLTGLLHDAAGRIPVESQLDAILTDAAVVRLRPEVARARCWPRYALAAAAVLVAVAAIGLVATGGSTGPAFAGAPNPVPAGAPRPGTIAPAVPDPPAWVRDLSTATREGGTRTGRWTRAGLGIVDGDVIRRPITIAAFDGAFEGATNGVEVEHHGHTFRELHHDGGTTFLFTVGEPKLMVTGPSDVDLAAIALATHVLDVDGQLQLTLDRLPRGYSVVVPPQVLAEDAARRSVVAANGGKVGVHEESDLVDPTPIASGADVRRVRVGTKVGWYFQARTDEGAWIAALSWSPRPGIVFEAVSTDPAHAERDLVELAEATEVVPAP
jgi:hypothetical protein